MTVSRNNQHSDWEQQFERLSAYLDDEVDEDERAALERHLPTCEECRNALEELRQTRALLRALPVPVSPRSFLIPETGAIPQPITRNTAAGTSSARHVRRARVLQWAGGLVAAVGLFILISSALQAFPHPLSYGASSTSSAGQSSAASSPLHQPSSTAVVTQRPSSTTAGSLVSPTATRATIPPTATRVAVTPTENHARSPVSTGTGNPIPLEPITGVLLIIAGAVLLLAGARLLRRL